ncbi:hypothetical protein F7018_11505 [Tenacibaculum aiptasiae]|uniref:Uncharacterized protein n=1 Tax=Tenacibaculum aiptasiae TaxID=426481 RepID=A0A7J5AER2_9FLAO|nr:hypothetical protein [Tenacibaculum aiptasiae]KAB1155928.1 hypothetical protein F7018_11505 [Tenacibaculum aiptasiae]
MNEIILQLLSKKTIIEGEAFLIPPEKGLKRKIFNHFSKKLYEKTNRNVEKLNISELNNILKKTIDSFKEKNHLFQIDINHSNWVEIQIIHPAMINQKLTKNQKEFGFVVHWVFDSMTNTNSELLEKMNILFNSSKYVHYKNGQTIDCFAFYCEEDTNKAYSITKTILSEICGYKNGEKYRFSISDNGKL